MRNSGRNWNKAREKSYQNASLNGVCIQSILVSLCFHVYHGDSSITNYITNMENSSFDFSQKVLFKVNMKISKPQIVLQTLHSEK